MGNVRQRFLTVLVLVSPLGLAEVVSRAPRFYDDDPMLSLPDLKNVENPRRRSIDPLYDFLKQSRNPNRRPNSPAGAVNTLGEVPDSSWYTNRHGRRRMTLDELRSGPGNTNAPESPFVVIGAKTEGITPGFTIRDARGRVYFVKPDPAANPELASAADVIGSKFFYALGYNTPENYILVFDRSELSIEQGAKVRGIAGHDRKLMQKDLERILERMPRDVGGRLRVVASLRLQGEPLGPFRYQGTRSDDPNDVVPHQHRRDLRGLHVMAAWLNHTDSKAGNSLDVLVSNGRMKSIKHYLIDFGAMLGSDSDMPKDARFGHAYMMPTGREALRGIFSFGFGRRPWESADYPSHPALGRFESEMFDPDDWKSNYPNPAFLSRLPDDEYWAAKQVMAFTDEDIRAIVSTGSYTDPSVAEMISRILIERRNKLGRKYFHKVLPLETFRIEAGQLRFDDFAVLHGFTGPRTFRYEWRRFDNTVAVADRVIAGTTKRIPAVLVGARYLMVKIQAEGDAERSVSVYFRNKEGQFELVGIDRFWPGRG